MNIFKREQNYHSSRGAQAALWPKPLHSTFPAFFIQRMPALRFIASMGCSALALQGLPHEQQVFDGLSPERMTWVPWDSNPNFGRMEGLSDTFSARAHGMGRFCKGVMIFMASP